MTTAAQEATDIAFRSLEIMSRALIRIGLGCDTAEQAQTIAATALYESAELHKEGQK